jgi:hypothetical protein
MQKQTRLAARIQGAEHCIFGPKKLEKSKNKMACGSFEKKWIRHFHHALLSRIGKHQSKMRTMCKETTASSLTLKMRARPTTPP